jgi:hypothetical protein
VISGVLSQKATLEDKCRFLFVRKERLYFEMKETFFYTRDTVHLIISAYVMIGGKAVEYTGKHTDCGRPFHEYFSDRAV